MSTFVSMATIIKGAFGSDSKSGGSAKRPITEDLSQLSPEAYMQRMNQLAKR